MDYWKLMESTSWVSFGDTHQSWHVHKLFWRQEALDLSRPLLSLCCLNSVHRDIHWTRHSGNKNIKITTVPTFNNYHLWWGRGHRGEYAGNSYVRQIFSAREWMEEGLLTQRKWSVRRMELWKQTALNTHPYPAASKQWSFWMLLSSAVKWEQ